LEGPVVIAEAVDAGIDLTDVFVAEDDPAFLPLVERCAAAGASILEVGDNVLKAIAGTATPQGVVAVAAMPSATLDDVPPGADLVLVLAEVRDPGNAGTLVRTAAAAGAGCVIFTKGSADPFGAKTVRASAGTIFKIPVVRGVEAQEALSHLKSRGFQIMGARGGTSATIFDVDLRGRTAIVLGNEAWGFDDPELPVDRWASIPIRADVESLNVATAGAVFLFEASRQRRLSSARHG
jgi:TrmH family RNA methyltransferase